ncbi:MAG: carboxypeptidase-like regulatory domain-containing protein [Saprospiraceae bacterium]
MKSILLLSLLLLANFSYSQTKIQGVVLDETGESVIGANIYLQDTYDGTSSDETGAFEFVTTTEGEATILVSYVGYEDFILNITIAKTDLQFNFKLEPSASELDAVVITAGAFEASDKRKAVVLKPLDIVMTAGATADIAGALNTLPGTQTVGETGPLFVRGGAASETRSFIDGMWVQKPYGSSVPNVPARGRFSPFLFKGTIFSTGGYSAEYGQALSAALILETTDLAPRTKTGVYAMTVGAGASHTQRWEKSSLDVSVDYFNLSPYLKLMPQNIAWDKAFQSVNTQLVFRQKMAKTGMFKVLSTFSRSGFALQYPDADNVLETNPLSLNNDNFYLNTTYKAMLGEKWSFFTGLAYSKNLDNISSNFGLTTQDESIQLKWRLGTQLHEKVSLKFGGEYLTSRWDEAFQDKESQRFESRLDETYLANFVETDLQLSKKLLARVGGRFEYSQLLQKMNFAPRTSLAYKTSKHSQISLAAGQFHQTPDNEQMRFQQNLNFESADHYLFNFQQIKGGRIFRVEAYWKEYRNLIRQAENGQRNNLGNGFARGIDFFYRDKTTINNGDFWISYSYLDTERWYRDFPEASTPNFASKHNASLVYKHWIPKWSSLIGFTYSISSPRAYNDPNEKAFNAARTPVFQDLSFNASYLTTLWGQSTVIYVAINNLPGFKNNFGQRFSQQANADGQFSSIPIEPGAKRFFLVGAFVTLGQRMTEAERKAL